MIWVVLTTAVAQWFHHRSPRLGAALAYYSVFSMGPLLLLVTAVAGLFFGADAVRGSLSAQFRSLLGPTGSKAIKAMLAGASSKPAGYLAAATGVLLILVAAVGVVAQLKDAMNTIWNVEDPKEVSLWWYVRTYLISFAGVLALGLLLTVALVLSAALLAISSALGGEAAAISTAWQLIEFVVSLAILAALFSMLFKWFPDTTVSWAGRLVRGDYYRTVVRCRQVPNRLVRWQPRTGIHLRRRRLDPRAADLGLLLRADRAFWRRTNPRLRRGERLPSPTGAK